ncbi:MAG: hypothetical protein R2849_00935 [Thermomicrobiales bacterium]
MLNDVKLSRRRVLAVGSAFAATAILAACGEADDDPAGNGGASSDDPTATPGPQPAATPGSQASLPPKAARPVIKVAYEGGFLAVGSRPPDPAHGSL